jgi:hypothetical protein
LFLPMPAVRRTRYHRHAFRWLATNNLGVRRSRWPGCRSCASALNDNHSLKVFSLSR